jgi:hypothetical protein
LATIENIQHTCSIGCYIDGIIPNGKTLPTMIFILVGDGASYDLFTCTRIDCQQSIIHSIDYQ